ncbi:MAG: hypothetical protein FVQ80_11165 [Planctomycetes bacterium]|nr:hypothetical protein [Planctomycetota bacterium]
MFKAKTDGDKNVFKVKEVDETPEGFTETNEYFIDSSGFGGDDEPALTPDQFLKKVKAGKYYAITGQGQFQVFVGEYEKIT